MRIGVISDTHGVVHPGVHDAFRGVEHIVHAGDVGSNDVVDELRTIAPVTFVPGNIDGVDDAVQVIELDGLRILLTHILPRPLTPSRHVAATIERERPDLVIFGHSHLPHDETLGGVRFFNPASAGPRRFDYPTSVGLIEDGQPRHVPLDARSTAALAKRMNQLSR